MTRADPATALRAATDERALRNLVARLAQAADDRDEAAYRRCFARNVTIETGPGERRRVSAADYAAESMTLLALADWTHHKLSNAVIRIEAGGVHASASVDVVVDVARTEAGGRRLHVTLGGRYDLGFIHLDDGWCIDRRIANWRYRDGDDEDWQGFRRATSLKVLPKG